MENKLAGNPRDALYRTLLGTRNLSDVIRTAGTKIAAAAQAGRDQPIDLDHPTGFYAHHENGATFVRLSNDRKPK